MPLRYRHLACSGVRFQLCFCVVETLSPLAVSSDYQGVIKALQDATPALEAFFDGENSVMVMSDDLAVRENRLNLLAVLRNQAFVLCDFSAVQGR